MLNLSEPEEVDEEDRATEIGTQIHAALRVLEGQRLIVPPSEVVSTREALVARLGEELRRYLGDQLGVSPSAAVRTARESMLARWEAQLRRFLEKRVVAADEQRRSGHEAAAGDAVDDRRRALIGRRIRPQRLQ